MLNWPRGANPDAKRGRPRQRSIPNILSIPAEDMLADAKWQNIAWRTGTKGKLQARFAAVRVRTAALLLPPTKWNKHSRTEGENCATLERAKEFALKVAAELGRNRNREELEGEHVCVADESGKEVFRTPVVNLRRTVKADEIIDEAMDMQRRWFG
jgi:hypothetical protein